MNVKIVYTINTNSDWEDAKKQKAQSLKALKKSFKPAHDIEAALEQASGTLVAFHKNHAQSSSDIRAIIESLVLPDDRDKREAALRKEINRFYKQRADLKSKAIAIQLSFEHARLQLQNPGHDWKNFGGLQKLQSNWKAEEYFNDLLVLMTAYQNTFPTSPNAGKLSTDIERMFELWNSQNIARQNYESQIKSYNKALSASDKHFIILSIIEYLNRRYKFNPSYKDELVGWCLTDIELYEPFLIEFHEIEFHENELFNLKQRMKFSYNPSVRQKKLSKISFDRVKRLKNYMVPSLPSYDVLSGIYEADKNTERLQWLQEIGSHIGYI